MKRRLHNMKTENDIDRHMPPTKTSTFLIYLLASPLLALTAWFLLIWACLNTDGN
jgi:hypothetical protein